MIAAAERKHKIKDTLVHRAGNTAAQRKARGSAGGENPGTEVIPWPDPPNGEELKMFPRLFRPVGSGDCGAPGEQVKAGGTGSRPPERSGGP